MVDIRNKADEFGERLIETNFARQVIDKIKNNKLFRLIYREAERIIEKKMLEEIKRGGVPKHIAIIMDGNRRYAMKSGLPPYKGHEIGEDKLKEVIEWCYEIGTKILTVFAFSTDNFKRPREEVNHLMKLFEEDLKKLSEDNRIHEKKVRIKIIGNIELLPDEVRKAALDIMKKTENYEDYFLNIAIGYGGREEILEAIRRIAKDIENGRIKPEKIDKETVASYLYTSHLPFPDPDLVMRTSGEERISNFLLWQLAYSELYFTDVYWPALKKTDFLKAIQSYQRRQRRYGE
ncbi:MAG: di-trans,poly-cis-decaprenylcistransferase [Thermoplasmatales archaeon]|nr:di-trans,poly-cis-decaprenylcistransferase [Thermoplasmatales archaeon]